MRKAFLFICVLTCSFLSKAQKIVTQEVVSIGSKQRAEGRLNFILGGALEFGGESIGELTFQDGSVQKIFAGQGGTFMAGVSYVVGENENFEIRGTLGYKYLTTKATNVNVSLTRIPLRFTGLWKPIPKLSIGGGFSTHMGIKFNGGGLTPNEKLSSSVAPTFELGYSIFSLVVTPMTYKDQYGGKFNASAVGLYFVAPLKRKFR